MRRKYQTRNRRSAALKRPGSRSEHSGQTGLPAWPHRPFPRWGSAPLRCWRPRSGYRIFRGCWWCPGYQRSAWHRRPGHRGDRNSRPGPRHAAYPPVRASSHSRSRARDCWRQHWRSTGYRGVPYRRSWHIAGTCWCRWDLLRGTAGKWDRSDSGVTSSCTPETCYSPRPWRTALQPWRSPSAGRDWTPLQGLRRQGRMRRAAPTGQPEA